MFFGSVVLYAGIGENDDTGGSLVGLLFEIVQVFASELKVTLCKKNEKSYFLIFFVVVVGVSCSCGDFLYGCRGNFDGFWCVFLVGENDVLVRHHTMCGVIQREKSVEVFGGKKKTVTTTGNILL